VFIEFKIRGLEVFDQMALLVPHYGVDHNFAGPDNDFLVLLLGFRRRLSQVRNGRQNSRRKEKNPDSPINIFHNLQRRVNHCDTSFFAATGGWEYSML